MKFQFLTIKKHYNAENLRYECLLLGSKKLHGKILRIVIFRLNDRSPTIKSFRSQIYFLFRHILYMTSRQLVTVSFTKFQIHYHLQVCYDIYKQSFYFDIGKSNYCKISNFSLKNTMLSVTYFTWNDIA